MIKLLFDMIISFSDRLLIDDLKVIFSNQKEEEEKDVK